MQRAKEYVEHLRRKPVHERERIAQLASAAIVGVVTLGYLAALTTSDRLTLESAPESNFAAQSDTQFQNLLGAAAAFNDSFAEGDITVVESKRSSTLETTDTGSATVIPF